MVQVFVCDDDIYVSEWFRLAVDEYAKDRHTGIQVNTFTDIQEMVSSILHGFQPDVIFLDVLFPNANGISSVKNIIDKLKKSRVILMTSSRDFALEGYAIHAYDYMLKPLNKQTVFRLLDNMPNQNGIQFQIKVKGIPVEINSADLMYVESDRHNLIFNLSNAQLITYGKLDDYNVLLETEGSFIRCHQSYLINLNYITDIKGRLFLMSNGAGIPIRKRDASEFKKTYYSFLLENPRNTGMMEG